MAHLKLNGYEIRIVGESTNEDDDTPQSQWRSVNGKAQSTYTNSKHKWSFETSLETTIEEGRALARLLRPQDNGHYWDCTTKYSSKGLLVESDGDITIDSDSPFASTDSFAFTIDVDIIPLTSEWTVMGWVKGDISSDSWWHFAERSDGALWRNQTRNDGVETPFILTGSNWRIDATDADLAADLVFYPFDVPDDWPEQFDATQPHSSLPRLHATGDFFDSQVTVEVDGMPSLSQQHTIGGLRAQVSFDLREV